MRRVGLRFLAGAVLVSGAVSPSWASPRFGRLGTFTVDGSPVGIRALSIDSQPGRDLLTANQAGPSLSFLLNRGLGSFFPEQRMSLSADNYILWGVAAGDFNADGRDDVAVAVDDETIFPPRATVLVYLNNSTGFAAPVAYPLNNGLAPQCIEAADVTGDGVLDLVVCDSTSVNGDGDGLITVLAGQTTGATPNGTFQSVFSGKVGTNPSSVASGDIDGDGHADLLIGDPGAQRVLILYGNGSPSRFESPVELATVTGPVAALINPIPGQALPQLLVTSSLGGALSTFKQVAPRTFATPTEQMIAVQPTAMALGAMDDDGVDDLIVISALGAELWYGQADGTFKFGETLTDDNTLDSLTLADLNGDGRIDVAASSSNKDLVTVILNSADVPFTPSPTPTITPPPTRTATPTRTFTPTSTPRIGSSTPTATRTGGPGCPGDCDGNGMVSIAEVIRGVTIALDSAPLSVCPAFDLDGNGSVSISELIAGVNSLTNGCAGAVH